MHSRSWLATTFLTLLLTGFVLIQARLRTGIPVHRAAGSRHTESRGLGKIRKSIPIVGDEPWRSTQATHWRACLLQQSNGCVCRSDALLIR
jgi:hypothetical protein